jgi:hypothetical protein
MSKITAIGANKELRHAPNASSRMDTVLIEMRTIAGWKIPPFQRQLRVNEKVREIAEQIRKDGGVIPGILTIGCLQKGGEAGEYLVDGQHRVEAFRLSECREAIADVRFMDFSNMADMGDEYVRLNSNIVRMRPDDVLRGLEGSTPTLAFIRDRCKFVGYDQIRRSPTSALVSMSSVLRVWAGSDGPTPRSSTTPAVRLAAEISAESATHLTAVLGMMYEAWGLDENSKRLWGALNLGLNMWLWRRLVADTKRVGNTRYIVLRNEQFKRCLMSLAANESYNDWLLGRQMSDRDRAPAYTRIRSIFTRRLLEDKVFGGAAGKARFPQPAWAKG